MLAGGSSPSGSAPVVQGANITRITDSSDICRESSWSLDEDPLLNDDRLTSYVITEDHRSFAELSSCSRTDLGLRLLLAPFDFPMLPSRTLILEICSTFPKMRSFPTERNSGEPLVKPPSNDQVFVERCEVFVHRGQSVGSLVRTWHTGQLGSVTGALSRQICTCFYVEAPKQLKSILSTSINKKSSSNFPSDLPRWEVIAFEFMVSHACRLTFLEVLDRTSVYCSSTYPRAGEIALL